MGDVTGGCLCGQLRYRASGKPEFAGYCCCADCRKASGSGFIPFMGFRADRIEVVGRSKQVRSTSFRGTESVRSICPDCGSLVFGGEYGKDAMHTVYAGSLDDPSQFEPRDVIFARDRPDWVRLPPGLNVFETMPD
ncbi:GFA family protein [Aureimonas leprariae]|uniref:GFA family protein n=1 Tax=Plantimonas leprariae TaxID=2615207 RepID=A0A7V7TXA0_9HYPH|nr:GFA family protein [Aureimonas leprariae]KAB0680638.1 GFA family protein [Aureimonas leprariae]